MRIASLLTIFLTLAATPSVAQDVSNASLTQCRDLSETGNFIGSDEVLVNGKVCKVVRSSPSKMEAPVPNSGTQPSASPQSQDQTLSSAPVAPPSVPPDKGMNNSSKDLKTEVNSNSAPIGASPAQSSAATAPPVNHREVPAKRPPIAATITFVTIQNGNVAHLAPEWATKWVHKNEKKYPDVRFQTSGEPIAGARNFVIAFSASSGEVQGFQPVTHTDTSTSTSPVSGSGTVTDNYGETWNYTYNGTVTTTTTTTTHEQVPYTRTSNTLYVTGFNEQGAMVAQRWHVYSTQSGGDAYNSLGYNLGNALAAINARGHLLKAIVGDVLGKEK